MPDISWHISDTHTKKREIVKALNPLNSSVASEGCTKCEEAREGEMKEVEGGKKEETRAN